MVKIHFTMAHNALKGIDTAAIETVIDEYLAEYPEDIFTLNRTIDHACVVIKARAEALLKGKNGR